MTSAVVVVMPDGIVLVEGEDVDVPVPVDVVVEDTMAIDVVEEVTAVVVVVDEAAEEVDDDVGDEVVGL